MSITAILIDDDRNAERFPVELDATVRNASAHPFDVLIEDLSATGFRMVGGPPMEIGTPVSIGFAGIGVQPARLTRLHDNSYGCEFITALSPAELSAALTAAPVTPIAFPTPPPQAWLSDVPEPHVEPYSSQTKLALAVTVPIVLWGLIAGIYWAS
jgi:hypothetical protein